MNEDIISEYISHYHLRTNMHVDNDTHFMMEKITLCFMQKL